MAVKIGLVGTGTVGGGCLDILSNHKQDFLRHFGIDLELARVCSRNPQPAISRGLQDIFTQDYHDIINDPEIDIVVELIGGTGIAKEVIKDALSAGKQVVTANKAIMASDGEEIMSLAEEKGVEIAFEASVGGGIPIIDPLKHSLIANQIDSIMGIVNGTTNYMLTRMDEDGLDYDAALKEAQERGFAEADPTADIDGLDAAAEDAGYTVSTGTFTQEDDSVDDNLLAALKNLKEGEVTDLIDGDSSYFVARLDKEVDEDATEETRQSIIEQRKDDLYDETLDGWKEGIEWAVKEKVWDDVNFDNLFTTIKDTETESTTEQATE